MTDEHHVALLAGHEIPDHSWRIGWLESVDCAELGERIAEAQKRLRRLPAP